MKRRKTKITMPVVLPPAVATEFERQWAEKEDEVFEAVKADIIAQLMATVLCYLNKRYGWKGKTLNSIKDGVQDLFIAMSTNGIMGKDFTTRNCIEYMQNMGVSFVNQEDKNNGNQP